MPTPIVPGSAQVVSEFVEKPPPITREVLESYLACKTKAYLKLRGERGTKTEYEVLAVETRTELQARAAEELASKYKPQDVMRGVRITEMVMKSGAAVIVDSTFESGDLSLSCDALKKVKGESRLAWIPTEGKSPIISARSSALNPYSKYRCFVSF
jgi:hypothetical protein